MTFKQIYNQVKDFVVSEDITTDDRSYWVDKAISELEERLELEAKERVISEVLAITMTYKMNHGKDMSKHQKRKLIISSMEKNGLINPNQ